MSRNEFIQLTAALTYAIGQREPNLKAIAFFADTVHGVAPLDVTEDLARCADALQGIETTLDQR